MNNDDKRKAHLSRISLENSRVDLSSPIVFLCGGLVNIKSVDACSVRDVLVRYVKSKGCNLTDQFTLAEDFKDWIHDSVYNDLLVFENDIAQISSLIVIILESPGALAELGLFVRNDLLNKKLVVFVNEKHYEKNSFISLGPIRYLKKVKSKPVYAYPWNFSKLEDSLVDSLPEMHEDLLSAMEGLDKSEEFDSNNDGHISFVLYEFIRIYEALKFKELESFANSVGLIINRTKLKRLLFLLTKFELISTGSRGNVEYYYSISIVNKIHFGGHFDRNAARISAMQFYASDKNESKRINFIKSLKNKPKKDEAA